MRVFASLDIYSYRKLVLVNIKFKSIAMIGDNPVSRRVGIKIAKPHGRVSRSRVQFECRPNFGNLGLLKIILIVE